MTAVQLVVQQEVHSLYRDHHGWLQGWLRKRLGNAFDAADLAHDTYVRVLASGQVPQPEQSRRFLTQIAKGLAIDLYRRRQIEAAYLETIALLAPSEVPSEETRALVVAALVELDALLHRLPVKARQALLLCKLDGLSYREIAQRLKVSVSSVEKYIAAALRTCYAVRYASRIEVALPMSAQLLADRPLDPAVVQRASEWMARLWSGEASDEDKAACTAWRAAHPDHECAWHRLQAVEDRFGSVPREAARRVLLESPPASISRRDALRLFAAVFVVGGVACTLRRTDTWKRAASDYVARTGEVRDLTLPDGTRVVLDTDSAIDVRYTDDERRVVLRTGRILVTTAADSRPARRPFRVECQQGTVRALGTRFTVRQGSDITRVAVYDGAVEIRPARGSGTALRLDAGQRTVFSDAQVQPALPTQETAAAWVQGKLVAEHMRVADFVAELARYRRGVLRCDDGAANLRVTGVFPLRDTDRALANLTLGMPVEVMYRTRYWATVYAR